MDKVFFLFDNVIFDYCNLRCDYCRPNWIFKGDLRSYFSNSFSTLMQVKKIFEELLLEGYIFAIYKISGYGEITVLPHFEELLIEVDSSLKIAPVNQIITNGIALNQKRLDNLISQFPEILFNISLDGHTLEMNRYRFKNIEYLDRIMKSIDHLVGSGIPVEVNTVITDANANHLPTFLEYFVELGYKKPNLAVYIQPVRDFSTVKNKKLKPTYDQMVELNYALRENYSHLRKILPPLEYLDFLFDTYLNGRKLPCFVPQLIFNIDPSMAARICSCGPTVSYDKAKSVTGIRRLLDTFLAKRWSLLRKKFSPMCNNCFTHFDILSLYILDMISEAELFELPMFKYKAPKVVIRIMKAMIKQRL